MTISIIFIINRSVEKFCLSKIISEDFQDYIYFMIFLLFYIYIIQYIDLNIYDIYI